MSMGGCLTVSTASAWAQPTTVATSYVLQLKLTRLIPVPLTDVEPLSVIIPVLYDPSTNRTEVADKIAMGATSISDTTIAVMDFFKRFKEENHDSTFCTLYPAVRGLVTNLTVPGKENLPTTVLTQAWLSR